MKELVLAFDNAEEAKYYYRSLAIEYPNVFTKKNKNTLIYSYIEETSFKDKLLIFLKLKKPTYDNIEICFKSVNSDLTNYKNIIHAQHGTDISIDDLYKKISKSWVY